MGATKSLSVYLRDHLAGASAGSELAKKLAANNANTPLGSFLDQLAQEIDVDKSTLEGLMDRLEIARDPVAQAAGWVTEKLSRLKLNEAVTGSAELTRLLELEALGAGIHGKLAAWRTLKHLRGDLPRLAGTDLDGLIQRARRQRDELEAYRLQAANDLAAPANE
ncbi:MAG: hypothetical protein JOZ47_06400 [Kutzneria sp.]|nr:hypothetical protein [Kutzneria sp.]